MHSRIFFRCTTGGLFPRRALEVLLFFALLGLAACRDQVVPTQVPAAATPTALIVDTPNALEGTSQALSEPIVAAPTAIPPSPTPTEPLAALVNGEPILMADYEKELARYEQAQSELGLAPADEREDYGSVVLEALIETKLIVQAAEANGLTITDAELDQRLAELKETSGGPNNFAAWLSANQWTEAEFREALARELLTQEMVDFVTADVPVAVEQVRARYIQVDDLALAQSLLEQIAAGADFGALARQYSLDRMTGENGGDLGFFAQGSLLVPEVEAAAFALQPGEVGELVTAPLADNSGTAYYLVQVLERDPQRPLSADLKYAHLQEAFEAWLEELWTEAEIMRFVGAGSQVD